MSDHSDHNASPFHQLPPVVVALAVVIGGVEVMFQLAALGLIGGAQGVGWRLAAMRDYAVLDAIATAMWNNQVILWDHMLRLIAYSLIHVGGFHAVMVVVFVLALGNYVGRVFAPLAVLAVFFGSAILGALAFVIILDSPAPLVGGYPGAYGLIGALTYIRWMNLGFAGENQMRAFGFVGVLLAIQLLFALIDGRYENVISDMSGFVAGFLLSFVVSPGGVARLLARLRQR